MASGKKVKKNVDRKKKEARKKRRAVKGRAKQRKLIRAGALFVS